MSRATPVWARKGCPPYPNAWVFCRRLRIGASFTGACPSCRDARHSGLQIAADHLGLASVGSARRDLDRFGFAFFIKDIYGLFAAASDIALLPGARDRKSTRLNSSH